MNEQTKHYRKSASVKQSGGCGCGGGHGSCSDAACGCGANGCEVCNPGLMFQPRFFSGQLLTEDDLQTMVNYVTTKNRIHNRYLHGSGVGCGLEVRCHPCGNGKVLVTPGYALDCCGNDILVPCEVTLDINAMVRELKLKQFGHDCGDPCEGRTQTANGEEEQIGKQYCLYLSYCEQAVEPVAPYTMDDQCSAVCEPSRIQEGYRFELRCPAHEADPPSFFDKIKECIDDLEEADFLAKDVERTQSHMFFSKSAFKNIQSENALKFNETDAGRLDTVVTEFEKDAGIFISETERVAGKKVSTSEVSESIMRRSLDNVHTLGSMVARYELLDEKKRAELESKHKGIGAKIGTSRDRLNLMAPKLEEFVEPSFSSRLEASIAQGTIENTLKFIKPDLSQAARYSQEAMFYASNVSITPQIAAFINQFLAKLQNWLLRKMNNKMPVTECGLYEEVASVVLTTGETFNQATIAALDILVRALLRYILDCICSAVIPPCPECEDPAVKLACLEVKECEVDNICNLQRTFLLTSSNMRYWIPLLHMFGEAIENICCVFSKTLDKPFEFEKEPDIEQPTHPFEPMVQPGMVHSQSISYFSSGKQAYQSLQAQPVFSNILALTGIRGKDAASFINLSSNVSKTVIDRTPSRWLPAFRGPLLPETSVDVATLKTILEKPQFKELIVEAAGKKIKEVEKRIDIIETESVRSDEDISENMGSRMRAMEEKMEKTLTSSKLSSSSVIKKLKTELSETRAFLEEQVTVNKDLISRLSKLEKAGR